MVVGEVVGEAGEAVDSTILVEVWRGTNLLPFMRELGKCCRLYRGLVAAVFGVVWGSWLGVRLRSAVRSIFLCRLYKKHNKIFFNFVYFAYGQMLWAVV